MKLELQNLPYKCMKRNWDDIQWIFKPDGALRDIYVQDVSLRDWGMLIDFLNENYSLEYVTAEGHGPSTKIEKEYVLTYLKDRSGQMSSPTLSVDFDGIVANCYFFLPDQIEFDIDPNSIKSSNDFQKVKEFMSSISEALKNQVTLTGENDINFPLIKIDACQNIYEALTEEEAIRIIKKAKRISNPIATLKTRFLMKFFPKVFEKILLKKASAPYTSTPKDKNLW